MTTKICNTCNEDKDISNYGKQTRSKDGYNPKCKACRKIDSDVQYAKNSEVIKARGAAYRADNKESIAASKKKVYEANKDEILAKNRERYANDDEYRQSKLDAVNKYTEANKDKVNEYQANYREENKEQIAAKAAEYWINNKEELSIKSAERYQNNRDVRLANAKQYRLDNPEKIKAYIDSHREEISRRNKKYYQVNKDKILKQTREWRKVNMEHRKKYELDYRAEFPERVEAKEKVRNAVRRGDLIKPNECSCCSNATNIQGHHWSYEEKYWLDVIWVCSSCHTSIHALIDDKREPVVSILDTNMLASRIDNFETSVISVDDSNGNILEELMLSNMTLLSDFSFLKYLTNLKKLTVIDCPEFSQDWIPDWMEEVTLVSLPKLTNLDHSLAIGMNIVTVDCRHLVKYKNVPNLKVLTTYK